VRRGERDKKISQTPRSGSNTFFSAKGFHREKQRLRKGVTNNLRLDQREKRCPVPCIKCFSGKQKTKVASDLARERGESTKERKEIHFFERQE